MARTGPVCVPIVGYYDNSASQCLQCPNGCSICVTPTFCIACFENYFLTDQLCYASCPARYFKETYGRTCKKCPYDCYICNSVGKCLQCNSTDFRVISLTTGRCLPLIGYFDNLVSVSVKCRVECSICDSWNNCTACSIGYYLNFDSLCYSSCPVRTYIDSYSQRCQKCYYDCLTCSEYGPCLTCSSVSDFRMYNSTSLRCVCLNGYY